MGTMLQSKTTGGLLESIQVGFASELELPVNSELVQDASNYSPKCDFGKYNVQEGS